MRLLRACVARSHLGRWANLDRVMINSRPERLPLAGTPAQAPVAQWIEQPPPKGQVARSIRVRGATFAPAHTEDVSFLETAMNSVHPVQRVEPALYKPTDDQLVLDLANLRQVPDWGQLIENGTTPA